MGIESFNVDTITEAPFSCAVLRRGQTSEILLEGELDLAAKPALDSAVDDALHSGPIETLMVDLTGVTFADSTTMTWLVHSNARTIAARARLVVVAGPGPVLDVLRMTGIDQCLTLVADGWMR